MRRSCSTRGSGPEPESLRGCRRGHTSLTSSKSTSKHPSKSQSCQHQQLGSSQRPSSSVSTLALLLGLPPVAAPASPCEVWELVAAAFGARNDVVYLAVKINVPTPVTLQQGSTLNYFAEALPVAGQRFALRALPPLRVDRAREELTTVALPATSPSPGHLASLLYVVSRDAGGEIEDPHRTQLPGGRAA